MLKNALLFAIDRQQSFCYDNSSEASDYKKEVRIMGIEALKSILRDNCQEHLLPFAENMSEEEAADFENEIKKIDFSALMGITEQPAVRGKISPIEAYTLKKREENREENRSIGIEALKSGKLAALMLAGGQGTRLGSDRPKGCYNIGITRDYYLFQAHVEKLLDLKAKHNVVIPLYIMTSDKNHEDTVAFFEEHDYFGYGKENIGFFRL